MKLPFGIGQILTFARLGSGLLGKLPTRSDGPLEVFVKSLAILDEIDKVYGGKGRAYESIFSRYKLVEKTSEPFMRLFFGTPMAAGFKLSYFKITDTLTLIEAMAPDGERLFFQEYRYGRPEVSAEFFHTPKFNFAAAMSTLWESYPHGLYLSVKPNQNGYGSSVTFTAVSPPRAELVSRKAAARIADGVLEQRGRAGEPWCFIAYGAPGTGKSSYVASLAAGTGCRLLKLDATSLPHLGVQEIGFLLDALAPDYLLIDDFEEAAIDTLRPRLRYLFEHLHATHAGVTIAVTVNDASKLDEALLRSERIDEAVEFTLPDAEERADVLYRLTEIHVPGKLDLRALTGLVAATDGFNHADLAALVKRFRGKPVAAALRDMQKLRALAAACAKKDEKAGDTPSKGNGKPTEPAPA